ncbi:MAG: hypothetical protein ACPH2K_05035, partial [Flavicella sp.]
AFLITTASFGQNKLQSAKESISKSSPRSQGGKRGSSDSKSNRNYDRYDSYQTSFASNFIEDILYQVTWGMVRGMLFEAYGERMSRHSKAGLTTYPYAERQQGDFDFYNTEKTARFAIENNYLTSSTIKGNYLKGELNFAKRISLTGDFLYMNEKLFRGGKTNYRQYTVMANYYRIRTPKISVWYGLGARYVGEEVDTYGFAYNFGMRLFLKKPLSFETVFTGSVIDVNPVNQFDAKLKWHRNKLFLTTGYNHVNINGTHFNQLSLGLGTYF